MERQAVEPLRGSFLNIVTASRVLWPGAQFTHQPASSESGDRVGDEAGNTFFERQRLGNATHMPRAILDADEHCAACRIGERDDCAQQSIGR